jgi:hypothetical protein
MNEPYSPNFILVNSRLLTKYLEPQMARHLQRPTVEARRGFKRAGGTRWVAASLSPLVAAARWLRRVQQSAVSQVPFSPLSQRPLRIQKMDTGVIELL